MRSRLSAVLMRFSGQGVYTSHRRDDAGPVTGEVFGRGLRTWGPRPSLASALIDKRGTLFLTLRGNWQRLSLILLRFFRSTVSVQGHVV